MNETLFTKNSFVAGRPVLPHEFVGRELELRSVFNRIRNGESTAIVGEPHVGKTSFLQKIADRTTQKSFLGDYSAKLIFTSLDLHPIPINYSPTDFWGEALAKLREHPGNAGTARLINDVMKSNYSRRSLEDLFNYLGSQERRIVLLLDEFEILIRHPKFQDPAFFALLRSLSTRTGGLVAVTSSRASVARLNDLGRGILNFGSPFFNNMIELSLGPFNDKTITLLFERTGVNFSQIDYQFIRRIAGTHPFLLQAMGSTLQEMINYKNRLDAAETFYARISYHFDDTWQNLSDNSRTVAVILSLMELAGYSLGEDYECSEIGQSDKFHAELKYLAKIGLAESMGKSSILDWKHLVIWQGERWMISSQAFNWWIRDMVIARSRHLPEFDDWLSKKKYRFFLTQGEWDNLTRIIHNVPEWAVSSISWFAKKLLTGLPTTKK